MNTKKIRTRVSAVILAFILVFAAAVVPKTTVYMSAIVAEAEGGEDDVSNPSEITEEETDEGPGTIIDDSDLPFAVSPTEKPHFLYMLDQMKSAEADESGKVRIRFQNEVRVSSDAFWSDFKKVEALNQPSFQRYKRSFTAFRNYDSTAVTGVQFNGEARSKSSGLARGKKADAKINAIVKNAKKKKGVKAKIKYVDNQLCRICSYDDSKSRPDCRNPYGALVEGKAVCEGYSEAFYACMTRLDIPCDFVKNKEESHMWCKVKVNGKWYHVDTCWNDVGKKSDRAFFLMSASKTRKLDEHNF